MWGVRRAFGWRNLALRFDLNVQFAPDNPQELAGSQESVWVIAAAEFVSVGHEVAKPLGQIAFLYRHLSGGRIVGDFSVKRVDDDCFHGRCHPSGPLQEGTPKAPQIIGTAAVFFISFFLFLASSTLGVNSLPANDLGEPL
jgi:hypothetical protein